MRPDVYCKLCGGLCMSRGERTIRVCFGCTMKAEKRQANGPRMPGYRFQKLEKPANRE